jgi:hypothetical protein
MAVKSVLEVSKCGCQRKLEGRNVPSDLLEIDWAIAMDTILTSSEEEKVGDREVHYMNQNRTAHRHLLSIPLLSLLLAM